MFPDRSEDDLFDDQFEDDLLDVSEFVELVNEERERAMRDADLTVGSIARVKDKRGNRR